MREYQRFAAQRPVEYARTVLGFNALPHQAEVLRAVADPGVSRVAWRSGNGVGKTYLSAAIICQYLDSHYPGLVVVTSASWEQLRKTVWAKLRSMVRSAPADLGGRVLNTEWQRDPDGEWGAFCVSPDAPENFAGFRTELGVLVIADEASALTYDVHDAILGLASAAGSKVAYLGNPLRPSGPFADVFRDPTWKTFHTSSEDVAQLNVPGLATEEWVADSRKSWGSESPTYRARVCGEFPTEGASALIPLAWVESLATETLPPRKGRLVLGVDVARYGADRTVLLARDDAAVREILAYSKQGLMETCGAVIDAARRLGVDPEDVYIDDCGVGGGVVDRLREQGFHPSAVNFGAKPDDGERFRNKRAECYWRLREVLDPEQNERPLAISVAERDLLTELTALAKELTSKGQIQIESKDKIKQRVGGSPDRSDALALTYAEGEAELWVA